MQSAAAREYARLMGLPVEDEEEVLEGFEQPQPEAIEEPDVPTPEPRSAAARQYELLMSGQPDPTTAPAPEPVAPEFEEPSVADSPMPAPATPEPDSDIGLWEGRGQAVKAGLNYMAGAASEISADVLSMGMLAMPPQVKSKLEDMARGSYAVAKDARAKAGESMPENQVGQFFTGVVDSLIYMGPSVATAYLTKNPAAALNVMGFQVFTNKYGESRADGKEGQVALTDAIIATAAELGPEKFMKFYDNLAFGSGVKAFLKSATIEAPSEIVTEAITMADEIIRQGKEITLGESVTRMGLAGLAGTTMGAAVGVPKLFGTSTPDALPDVGPSDSPQDSPLDGPALKEGKEAAEELADQSPIEVPEELPVPSPTTDATSTEAIQAELNKPVEVPEVPKERPATPDAYITALQGIQQQLHSLAEETGNALDLWRAQTVDAALEDASEAESVPQTRYSIYLDPKVLPERTASAAVLPPPSVVGQLPEEVYPDPVQEGPADVPVQEAQVVGTPLPTASLATTPAPTASQTPSQTAPILTGQNNVQPEASPEGPRGPQSPDWIPDQPLGEMENATGISREMLNADRAARGMAPLTQEETIHIADTIRAASAELAADPAAADRVVDRIYADPNYNPSLTDVGVLHQSLHQARKSADAAADLAADETLSEDVRQRHREENANLEAEVERINQAAALASNRVGGTLRYFQEIISDVWTKEGVLRMAKAQSKTWTPEQEKKVVETADKIDKTKRAARKSAAADEDKHEKTLSQKHYNKVINEAAKEKEAEEKRAARAAAKEQKAADKAKKKEKTQAYLDRLKTEADIAAARLKADKEAPPAIKNKKQGGAVILPIHQLKDLFIIGKYHIARGVVDFADWVVEMQATVGDKLFNRLDETDLQYIHQQSRAQFLRSREATNNPARQEALMQQLQEDRADNEPLSHETVYGLVKIAVSTGAAKGEAAVMKLVHEAVQTVYPDATERDVRKAFVKYGEHLEPTEDLIKLEMAQLSNLVRLGEHVARILEGKDPLSKGSTRPKLTQEEIVKLQEFRRMQRAYEALLPHAEPNRLRGINEKRAKRLEALIAKVEAEIEARKAGNIPTTPDKVAPDEKVSVLLSRLAELREELNALKDAQKQPETEAQYNARIQKLYKIRIAELKEKIEKKDFAPGKMPEHPPKSRETVELEYELNELKSKFLYEQYLLGLQDLPWNEQVWNITKRAFNISRAVKTSLDLSATTRQGAIFLAANPKFLGLVLKVQKDALLDPAKAHAINKELVESEAGQRAAAAGIFINDPHSARADLQEEAYQDVLIQNGWLFKTFGVAGSARAYNTALNVMRVAYYTELENKLTINGVPLNEAERKAIAHWVNVATGRAAIGKGVVSDAVLSIPFFAPRWVASRFSLLTAAPLRGPSSLRVKGAIAKEYGKATAGLLTFIGIVAAGLALMAGDDDEFPTIGLDPGSSDFLKLKTGDTRVDLTAGISQTATFIWRVGSGILTQFDDTPARRSAYGQQEWGSENLGWVIGRFIESKLSPAFSAAYHGFTKKDYNNQDTSVFRELIRMPLPLSFGGTLDAMEEQGVPKALALQLLVTFGAGTNTYEDRVRGSSADSVFGTSALQRFNNELISGRDTSLLVTQ